MTGTHARRAAAQPQVLGEVRVHAVKLSAQRHQQDQAIAISDSALPRNAPVTSSPIPTRTSANIRVPASPIRLSATVR